MNPFTAMIVAQHIDELRREAAETRRARARRDSHGGASPIGGWTRLVGRSARNLSVALDGLARRLDPVQPGDESQAGPVAA